MAGRIREEDIALVRERTSIADVISEHVTLKSRRRRQPQGPVPVPRREDPVVHRRARPQRLLLPRLRARWRRHHVPDGRRPPDVRRVGRAAGRPGRHPAAVHRGRPGPGPPAAGAEAAPGRRARRGRRVLRVPARARPAPGWPASSWPSAASTATRPSVTAAASPPTPGTASPSTCARRASPARSWSPPGLAREARSGSLIDRFRRRLLWPIRDLSGDVIGFGARKLFDDDDGPKYLNTPETPIYKKSHVLYGIDHAKREIAQAGAGGHRRGLHRRDGLPPGRRDDGGRHLRHVVRRRPHRRAAAAADGHRRGRRRDHLHLRRRRRRARRRRCAPSRRTSASSGVRSSRSARTTWTRASCGWPRATWRCATWSPAASRWSTSRCARC